ncbi:exodeoxyribonuclease VII large subunit [Pasteurellaceae bacterium Macca]|nr:exodeoxyribonuclease VII large subunit [Pasteurellaceae bacterium Macca]
MENRVLTIAQLNRSVKTVLEIEFGHVWLVGEISNFSQPVSGHWYLTLKDEQAQVRCAMFRMKNQRVNFRPQNGMQVLVRATVSLYEPRGDYQVIIESMQPAGDGLLQQQFEQLKMKLASEGLFAQSAKKPIPDFVKRVGIITSSSGAALQDMLNILKRRDPSLNVVIYPTMVQGKEATAEIIAMLALANARQECDVLILGRGGGSLEDLWCFNEEALARAIFASQIPIISAVGHETDVTISDFVADLRAPTPSAAAELVSRDQQELIRQLQHQFDKINLAFDRLWTEKTNHFARLRLRLNAQHPARQLQHRQQRLAQVQQQAQRAMQSLLFYRQHRLEQLSQRLQSQHPSRQLARQWEQLQRLETRSKNAVMQLWLRREQRWQRAKDKLYRNPLPHHIQQQQQQWGQLEQRLIFAMEKTFNQRQQAFGRLCVQLEGLSPLKILARGYSVTQNAQGVAITTPQQVALGEQLTTRLAKGYVLSEVTKIVE